MFYPFSINYEDSSRNSAIIWEIETTLSSIIKEAQESRLSIDIASLKKDFTHLINLEEKAIYNQAEFLNELEVFFTNNTKYISPFINNLHTDNASMNQKICTPDRVALKRALDVDSDFRKYISGQRYQG